MVELAPARVRLVRPPLPLPRHTDAPAGPIVKWAGGKSRLLDELLARAPSTYGRYHEPFVGGGALFFRLAPPAAVLADVNAELIACYRSVAREGDAVIAALARHRARHDESYYYAVREGWNGGAAPSPAERAATFLYLNKTCYNGLWRVNRRGLFNVPLGRYDNPAILDEGNLRAAARQLARARLEVAPFEHVLEDAAPGDFVYFDPPYDPLTRTAYFTQYAVGGFGQADQERLAEVFRELDGRGCAVMLSNHDTPFVRRLFAGYRIDRVLCSRNINSRADARGACPEVIVRNRY